MAGYFVVLGDIKDEKQKIIKEKYFVSEIFVRLVTVLIQIF